MPSAFVRRILAAALTTSTVAAAPLTAQDTASAAASYMERYNTLLTLAPMTSRAATVSHLVLRRDAGTFTLERGTLALLAPLDGRTVGAVFRGEGTFRFAPTLPVEREELQRFAGTPELTAPISDLVLLFTDSTLEDLAGVPFGQTELPGGMNGRVRDFLNSLKGDKDGSYDPAVMAPLLNGVRSGMFAAYVVRTSGDPLFFLVDPSMGEAIQLRKPVGRREWGANWAVVSQFTPRWPLPGSESAWEYRHRLEIPRYRLAVTIHENTSGNLSLGAGATITAIAREAVGPWLRFTLDPRLDIDSARIGDVPAASFKADDDRTLWVRLDRRLQADDSASFTVYYHGTLIDRVGNWFFMNPLSAWYPINEQGPLLSQFDITYDSPIRYPLVSIGELADSTVTDRLRTTHWVTHLPTATASFNLGLLDRYDVQHPGAPPINVMLSEDAHREMRRQYASAGAFIPEQSHMRENVAADVSNALMFFGQLFGPAPYDHFTVDEIPYGEGVSFPGLIHLSWGTFQNTSTDGFDEFFRAHEASHQWWGNGVRPGSYRDAWLSEGLATYCGLWYLRLKRHKDDPFYHFLDQYRADIGTDQDVGPIWIGYRAASPRVQRGYDVMVYEKGAWVFNMLRVLMTDLRTMNADRFTETLRDFYQTYQGLPATTADFQSVVERHMGIPMDWFFDEWVKGTAIPTYHFAWHAQPADNGRWVVAMRIRSENVPAGFHMPVLVAVDIGGNRTARFRVDVTGGQTAYTSPLIPGEPREVVFNDLHSVLADVHTEGW